MIHRLMGHPHSMTLRLTEETGGILVLLCTLYSQHTQDSTQLSSCCESHDNYQIKYIYLSCFEVCVMMKSASTASGKTTLHASSPNNQLRMRGQRCARADMTRCFSLPAIFTKSKGEEIDAHDQNTKTATTLYYDTTNNNISSTSSSTSFLQ